MNLQLAGKTAVVTGASSGLGRAIARALALEGVRVCAIARREELLQQLVDEVGQAGGERPRVLVQDILADDAAARIADAAQAAFGTTGILVNCAGGSRREPLDAPEEVWTAAHTLNFIRPRQIAHALLPAMMAGQWGRIINISGKSEPEHLSPTGSAKAAIHAWSKQLSRETGRYGITVNCIAPGRIMSEQIRRKYPEDFRREFAEKEIAVGYWGEPEDLAVVALFLASPLARYVSGAVIPVDGGLRRYQF